MNNIVAHLDKGDGKWLSYFYLAEEQYIISFLENKIKILKTKSSKTKSILTEILYKDIDYVTLKIETFDKIELIGIKNKFYTIKLEIFKNGEEYTVNICEIKYLKYIFNKLKENKILIKDEDEIMRIINLNKDELIYYFKK